VNYNYRETQKKIKQNHLPLFWPNVWKEEMILLSSVLCQSQISGKILIFVQILYQNRFLVHGKLSDIIERKLLPFVEKPLRYTGAGEYNKKKSDSSSCMGVLCFPDLTISECPILGCRYSIILLIRGRMGSFKEFQSLDRC
jgi:hypothetical protein